MSISTAAKIGGAALAAGGVPAISFPLCNRERYIGRECIFESRKTKY